MTHDTTTATAESTSPPEEKLLITVEEAAHRLGISRTVMYRLVSSGLVESVRVGRLRRIPPECLDEFVATLRAIQAPKRHTSLSAG